MPSGSGLVARRGGQVGAAIGGYVGGVIDPTQFNGPRIGDGQNQNSADGQPIAWVIGTGPTVGNIMQAGPRYEVKKTDDGKGSTTETNTFEAHQSFAILICESSETRDSTIIGIQMVRQNGKIVYDVRPGSTMLAESAKWKEKVTFYFGAEDQNPDPTLEAITGVGNTPSYRGICYAVFRDFNRSEFGDAIPTFEWVVVSEGTSVITPTDFEPGQLSAIENAHFPLTDNIETDYEYSGFWHAGLGGGITSPTFDTIADVQAYFANVNAATGVSGTPNALGQPNIYVGYIADTGDDAGNYVTSTKSSDIVAAQPDAVDFESVLLLYQFVSWVSETDASPDSFCPSLSNGSQFVMAGNGSVVRRVASRTSNDYQAIANCGSDLLEGVYPVTIKATRKRIPPDAPPGTAMPDAPGWYLDANKDKFFFGGYSEIFGTFKVLSIPALTGSDPSRSYTRYENGPALRDDDPNYSNATFWEDAYDDAVAAGDLPAGWTYGVEYPVGIASVFKENENPEPEVTSESIPLSTIMQRINLRGGLTDNDIDVTELTDMVIGYPIARQCTAADAMRPLQGCYFFKTPEYDRKIRCIKDGADATLAVDPLLFIDGSEIEDEDTRKQAKEYPRKITSSYYDPDLNFTVGKGKAERRSQDIRAIGEMSLEIPVVMVADEAWQVTDKAMKVAWARLQGGRKFSLPFDYLEMVPSYPFGLEGKRYIVDQITLQDGELAMEVTYDRQSAYTSAVTAVPTLAPTPPASTLQGPTILVPMNLPPLRTQDNVPGMYLAATGQLPTWRGCIVYLSKDGGESFEEVARISTASVIGELTDDITVDGSTAEPILIEIENGELSSATDTQLAVGANAFAMIDGNDVAEIAQFKTQNEFAPDEYALTEVGRGLQTTTAVDHFIGERFVALQNVLFLPLDAALAGLTLIFRGVSYGSDHDLNPTVSIVFIPHSTGPVVVEYYEDENGSRYTNQLGAFYQVT